MERPRFNYTERKENVTSTDLDRMFPVRKQLFLFGVGYIGIHILGTIISLLIMRINVAIGNPEGYNLSTLTNVIGYTALFAAMLLISGTDLKKLFGPFKKWQPYVAGIVCFIAIIAFSIVYGNLISLLKIPVEENANQQSIDSAAAAYPFVSVLVFGIFAPVCEELTYRVGLFSLLKRKSRTLAFLVTMLVFALIHFDSSVLLNLVETNFSSKALAQFANEVLNLPYYLFAGFAFSFTFDRFGFAGSVTAHIINNVLSLTVLALII